MFSVIRDYTAYSGFNMGAGEASVMSMLYQLMLAGKGSLLVIDEIELGLHAKAQKELISVLKEICQKNQNQIICSTHSEIVLISLPQEARFYVESDGISTNFLEGVAPELAFGKLSGENSAELKIYVEDSVAKTLLECILDSETRKRVKIFPVGSADGTILHQMAACLRENNHRFLSILDGDKKSDKAAKTKKVLDFATNENPAADKTTLEVVINERLCFLPGTVPPEKYVVEKILTCSDASLNTIKDNFGCFDVAEVKSVLSAAKNADTHDIIYDVAQAIARDKETVWNYCCQFYKMNFQIEINYIITKIIILLNE